MLPKEAVEEFKEIYRKVFLEEINDAEAAQRANRLLELYKAVLDPPPSHFKQE